MAKRTDPMEEQISNILKMETVEVGIDDPVAPDQRLSRGPDPERKPMKNSKDTSRKARAKERRKDDPEGPLRHRAAEIDV